PDGVADPAEICEALSAMRGTPAARHGAELAILDLLARERGIPLARLMSPTSAGGVHCSALLDGLTVDANRTLVVEGLESGFRVFKLKIGARTEREDFEQIDALLAEVQKAPAARLRLDANGALSREAAAALFEHVAGCPIDVCEQPVGRGDFDGL